MGNPELPAATPLPVQEHCLFKHNECKTHTACACCWVRVKSPTDSSRDPLQLCLSGVRDLSQHGHFFCVGSAISLVPSSLPVCLLRQQRHFNQVLFSRQLSPSSFHCSSLCFTQLPPRLHSASLFPPTSRFHIMLV